jgi:hypothetical protein
MRIFLTDHRNPFPTPRPDSNNEKLYDAVDQTMGGQITPGNSNDPEDHVFGFYIMSGPEDEITTINKRELGTLRLQQHCRRQSPNPEGGIYAFIRKQ